ncbi:RNA polymerase factor sigma-32 [Cognatishimia sp. WU-CL00825]|uniref:RNA polymerase factor sigma-32 n=1 Tax=Cognatishimia sp. WU-CL00825 TaxID=3127658 RepID=UPI0031020BB3
MQQGYSNNLVTRSAMKAEMLDVETEQALARAWRDDRDEAALHRLVNAYMRLAISMATRFRRYGVPMNDLIQEAGVGLMKAAEKFDPDRGVRFSTYAVWWIKASVQDHVMRSWSLVRTGSTSSQKSLFFNLKRVQAQLEREARSENQSLDRFQLSQRVAMEIGVSVSDVEMMQGRLQGGDYSLNAVQGGDEDGREWIDVLEDDAAIGAEGADRDRDRRFLRGKLVEALDVLSDREKMIVRQRKLGEKARTLEKLGADLGISKERVRQLEVAALAKMRHSLEQTGADMRQFMF